MKVVQAAKQRVLSRSTKDAERERTLRILDGILKQIKAGPP